MTIQVETRKNAKLEKRPAPCSAGIVGLDLTPEKERVALVLNIASEEVQLVPKKMAHRKKEYKNSILKDDRGEEIVTVIEGEEYATASFLQPDGFGTMFGKMEDEDGGDPVKTALREGLEESGMELEDSIVASIFHREKPHPWGPYFNIVYPANCVGMEFRNELIRDEFINKAKSGFYPLFALPYRKPRNKNSKRKQESGDASYFKAGMYQAAIRRIVAVLLQLDRRLLAEFGRPGRDNADDLVKMVLARVRYFNLFSQRMLKMLVGLKREDLILERLARDGGIIQDPFLAAHVAANVILWIPLERMDETLEALMSRCNPTLRLPSRRERGRFVEVDVFLGECLIRRRNTLAAYGDKQAAVRDDKDVVEEENTFAPPEDHVPNYARIWLEQEAKDAEWRKKRAGGGSA